MKSFDAWMEDLVGITGLCGSVVDGLFLANVRDYGREQGGLMLEMAIVEKLRAYMKGNLGFDFATKGSLDEIRDVLADRRWQGARAEIWYCHRDRLVVWIHLRLVSSGCSVLESRFSRTRSN